jgi:integrase
MRTPKPWYRSQNDTWYICLRGKQVPLAHGKQRKREAQEAYFQLMAAERLPPTVPQNIQKQGECPAVAVILDQFLDWVQRNLKRYEWYRHFLEDFAQSHGQRVAFELKPLHVTQWLATKSWGPTTRNRVIGLLKQAFNWAVEQGWIAASPIRALKKPTPKRRERILTAEDRALIRSAISDAAFRDFVIALQETGARPGEVAQVSAHQVDLENALWVLTEHKTAGRTGRPRIIYLTPTMVELCRQQVAKNPSGPLFRNSRGRPWTGNAVRCRFRRLRKRHPELKGVVAYCYRHTFATDGLERGVPIATMAELLGHSSTAMLSAHYGHLSQKGAYLRQAVIAATGSPTNGCASTPPSS